MGKAVPASQKSGSVTHAGVGFHASTQPTSILYLIPPFYLVVEVVSTNWRDDYQRKAADYEEMGIPEFWLVDYLGLGGRRYIGTPKQPTFSVYQWVDGEYQVTLFQGAARILSPTFPDLALTLNQIL